MLERLDLVKQNSCPFTDGFSLWGTLDGAGPSELEAHTAGRVLQSQHPEAMRDRVQAET